MGYWSNTPPAVQARLGELAQSFRDCRDTFFELADTQHWTPVLGSGAARAAQELPSPDPVAAGRPGESGHRLITEVIQTYMLTASFHMASVASLYDDGEVMFSPPALIRSTVENCARAVWVLGDDADEPIEARLARAYLEELLSAEEEKRVVGKLHGEADPRFAHARAQFKSLQKEIKARFPGTDPADLGGRSPTLMGHRRLGPEAAVQWMYALTESYGGTTTDDQALGIYGLLSNMTHPTLYPARQRRGWIDDPAAGHAVAYLRVDIDSSESQARLAIAAFYNALNYVSTYFGWPDTAITDLESKIGATIPGFFR